ncbi:MAG: hypothetical protein FJ222_03355 [Lentisphaerae bacterium]|nr:hypothetical protein [Lentisphaerota bacterium]
MVSDTPKTTTRFTLDGSPALVSLTGPSGTTNAVALGNLRFEMRYPGKARVWVCESSLWGQRTRSAHFS